MSYSASLTMLKSLTVWIMINNSKFLEMWILDRLTCLPRNPYVGQEAALRSEHGSTEWFKIGKRAWLGYILSLCLFNSTLCNPVDYSLPGSSVHEILQARILEWVAISFSRGSSQPRDWTQVSCIGGRHFNLWATREVKTKWQSTVYTDSLKWAL